MQPLGAKAFDRDDRFADGVAGKKLTRSRRGAIDMDRAGAALSDAAAKLGPGQADLVAQHPKHRRFRLDVEIVSVAVDTKRKHAGQLQSNGRRSHRGAAAIEVRSID